MSAQGQGFAKTVTSYRFGVVPSIDDCIEGAQNTKKNFDHTLENVKNTYENTVDNVRNGYENTVDLVKSTQENTVDRVKSNFGQGIFKGIEQTITDVALFVMSWRIWQTKTVQEWFKHFFVFSKFSHA